MYSQFKQLMIAAFLEFIALHQGSVAAAEALASSNRNGSTPSGAIDADQFGIEPSQMWSGSEDAKTWWWQCRWEQPRLVGAILQIVGDDPLVLRNAPRRFVWQFSLDGREWVDLNETSIEVEGQNVPQGCIDSSTRRRMQYLRIRIDAAQGDFPAIRHVEVYEDTKAHVDFPDWIITVATIDRPEWEKNNSEGKQFVSLARSCPGWENVPAQFIWLDHFDEKFVSTEPRPLCAFLSGNFSDFCQKDREVWRGADEIVKAGHLPIWAACGGAQGLAILADTGLEKPWDCPHCRDPLNPKSPIYGHIGHRSETLRKCGDYGDCLFERGKSRVLMIADDPAFEGLHAHEFEIMESHCGQIEYAPKGWVHIVTKGPGGKTNFQCLRVNDRYIYAAQFHIEMAGTPKRTHARS